MPTYDLAYSLIRSVISAFTDINNVLYKHTNDLSKVCGIHEMQPEDELLMVDRMCADIILSHLTNTNIPLCIIIEEHKAPIYINCETGNTCEIVLYIDPFDGSKLFKRRFNAFWASAVGVYVKDSESFCVVANHNDSEIYWAHGKSIFRVNCNAGIESKVEIKAVNDTEDVCVSSMYVETYLMDPSYYLNSYNKLNGLLRNVKCIVPNGGPLCFMDVLLGKSDIYIGLNESVTEVFSALPIATIGGLIVKNIDGKTFEPNQMDRNEQFDFICSRNERYIHEALKYIDQKSLLL